MKHHLTLYSPANPERFNPDHWRDGEKWTGPLSGNAWRKVYKTPEWEGKRKPAPAFNECRFLKRQVHQDVCAAVTYDACKRCCVPKMYGVRMFLPKSLAGALRKLFNAVKEGQ